MSILLQVKDLKVTFPVKGMEVPAVNGINFSLHQGKVLGIVGESGCGKTVSALSLLRLVDEPGRIASGSALYYGELPKNLEIAQKNSEAPLPSEKKFPQTAAGEDEEESTPHFSEGWAAGHESTASVLTGDLEPEGGVDLFKLNENEMRTIRGNKIAMIFQEPMTSLNPVFTVGDQIMEAILLHQKVKKSEARNLAVDMLRKVHIPDPEKRLRDYPHQMSGGMRQRVMIAMALSCQPDILIADEPTTALDVTIQAQILDLIQELIDDFHMSVILITHDLGVVAQICDEVVVMYAGVVAEHAPVKRLFKMPKHPYTIGLLDSIPSLFDGEEKLHTIAGTVPSLGRIPPGCPFSDRCPRAVEACRQAFPPLKYVGEKQEVRCINY